MLRHDTQHSGENISEGYGTSVAEHHDHSSHLLFELFADVCERDATLG
jgi:hypothetical protein